MDWELLRSQLNRATQLIGVIGTLVVVVAGQTATWVVPTYFALLVVVGLTIVADGVFYFVLRGVPWSMVRRDLRRLIDRLHADNFAPDLVIGAGRAGSIIGAMVAANLGHCPFIALDVQYDHSVGPVKRRIPIINGPMELKTDKLRDAKIVVAFAYMKSGDTARGVAAYLTGLGIPAANLRYASLYADPDAGEPENQKLFYCVSRRKLSGDRWRTTPWHVRDQYDYR
jgi:hypoxanthine phosphoribosyltransferase